MWRDLQDFSLSLGEPGAESLMESVVLEKQMVEDCAGLQGIQLGQVDVWADASRKKMQVGSDWWSI